jgi:archaellum component FlaC
MTSKDTVKALVADVERLMKLHESAMAEVVALREKSSEQAQTIRALQEQLRDAKAEVEKAALHAAIAGSVSLNSMR